MQLLKVIAIFVAICGASLTGASAESMPRSVLIINQSGPNRPWYVALNAAFRATLNGSPAGHFSVYVEDLDLNHFNGPRYEQALEAFFHEKYREVPIGVIVAIGGSALDYALRWRNIIWPGVPIIMVAVDEKSATRLTLPPDVTGSIMRFTLRDMVNTARTLMPDLRRVALVGDSLERQTFYRNFQQELPEIEAKLELIDLTGIPMADLLRRVATLPDRTAIVYTGVYVDGAGISYIPAEALSPIAEVANRPIIIDVDSYLGIGGLGGYLVTAESVGQDAANLALRIFNGENASNIPIKVGDFLRPIFDWRQLRRWGISERTLPAGSEVRFRPLSLWELYKWYILTAATLCIFEAVFIVVLLLNRRRLQREHVERQRAEGTAREFSRRLISAQEDERSRLARELHDDITQRLALLAIEAGRAARKAGNGKMDDTMSAMLHGLTKLSEDVHALSYRLHPSILDDLGLVEALKNEAERFSRLESVPVDLKVQENLVAPNGQIALGLFRIAQEALKNVGRHAKAGRVMMSLRQFENGFEFCIGDDGVGFEPKAHRERPSLGLASIQERICSLGGELNIESSPGHGTIVLVWAPSKEEHREPSARAAS